MKRYSLEATKYRQQRRVDMTASNNLLSPIWAKRRKAERNQFAVRYLRSTRKMCVFIRNLKWGTFMARIPTAISP